MSEAMNLMKDRQNYKEIGKLVLAKMLYAISGYVNKEEVFFTFTVLQERSIENDSIINIFRKKDDAIYLITNYQLDELETIFVLKYWLLTNDLIRQCGFEHGLKDILEKEV